ncbi:sensor histidine kinase of FgrL, PAS and PAS domain-containing [Geotalea daltonii FRC-32]|uniref:histidine kinase n=1 Tax=Geotalea daltonii (strain DSM 22248 / JCM 15807 / FRC-32) TaxID=316067 RepID=B9M7T0_GEODF|nr:PAS domain S-box protein [Geotalea daltonii]ACM18388.1 sensor histidine kinase of FgrL, PAS and PAS domain-containing [Geotalea daltonii FRC-32]
MERAFKISLKITVIYILVGAVWILFSDELLAYLVQDVRTIKLVSISKGWFFVAATGLMLYFLVRRHMLLLIRSETAVRERNRELARTEEELRRQIVEQQKTEAKLHGANQRLRTLFHTSPLAIVALDPGGRVTQWNKAAQSLFGWTAEEIKGSPYPLLPEWSLEEQRQFMEKTLRGEVSNDIQVRRKKKNGELLDVSLSIAPTRDADGAVTGIMAILADITERRKAEEASQASKQLYVELVDSIDGIVWELDYKTFCFTFVSKRAEELLGYPAEEWLKSSSFWQDHLHPADRDGTVRLCLAASDQGKNHELVYRFLAANGDYVWLRDIVTVSTEKGHVAKLRGVMFDITTQKIAAEALLASEERYRSLNAELEKRVMERTAQLEEANRELESFSYSVSHDLRAPLRHIEGFSQLLLEDYGKQLDEEGQSHLLRLKRASQRMSQLIDDLLELSRVTRSELNCQATNLSRMAHLVLLELGQSQPERKVKWEIAEDVMADGDARLLRVVMENLLGNAWKYTARNEEAIIEFGSYMDRGAAIYYVRDNGAGFDMKYADKLFAPFQRLHRTEEFEGTGIGLATVKRIVGRHGGRIWAESAPEAGATFYFTLSGVGE